MDLAVGCLPDGPDFSNAEATLRALGYTEPTDDPKIKGRGNGAILAGKGSIQLNFGGKDIQSEACLIYARGVDALAFAKELMQFTDILYPGSEPVGLGDDIYWNVQGKDGRPMVLCVSPKTTGTYAGYVLLFAAAGTGPSLTP